MMTKKMLLPSKVCPIVVLVVILATGQEGAQVMARYLHPAARNYGPAIYNNDYQLTAHNSMPMLRRQDDDDASSDADDDLDDQNAAASYRNQDDDANNQGADGYEDNEADGPYEETPVEREGQADLERFFDDHLGASDRDGMDKENLPTNLVATVSEPPMGSAASNQDLSQTPPIIRDINADWPRVLPAFTSDPPSQSSSVQPLVGEKAALVTVPTFLKTSITRLPNERKLIVTNQITRSRIGGPIGYDKGNGNENKNNNNNNNNNNDSDSDDDDADNAEYRATNSNGNRSTDRHEDYRVRSKSSSSSSSLNAPSGLLTSSNNETSGRQAGLKMQQQIQRLPSLLLSIAANQAGRQVQIQQPAAVPRDARNDNLSAISSEVVAIEDDDYDRVYVTNATHKPFRIDALGGYDPEADFRDAARDLEVGQSARSGAPSGQQGRRQLGPRNRAATARDANLDSGSGDGDDDSDDEDADVDQASSNASGDRSQVRARPGPTYQPSSDMYEDASETDEVTFGQDDPYQTDLEAEMRQQSYDRVGTFKGDPSRSDDSNGGAPTGLGVSDEVGNEVPTGDSNSDVDADIENDYKDGGPHSSPKRSQRRRDDVDDEGSWINDGVDEMDIPSQSHQNYVLDKAAKHDAMKRRQAEQEQVNAADNENQSPDGQPASEDTSSYGEDSERMPNADYLKNDDSDDDSGYAA